MRRILLLIVAVASFLVIGTSNGHAQTYCEAYRFGSYYEAACVQQGTYRPTFWERYVADWSGPYFNRYGRYIGSAEWCYRHWC